MPVRAIELKQLLEDIDVVLPRHLLVGSDTPSLKQIGILRPHQAQCTPTGLVDFVQFGFECFAEYLEYWQRLKFYNNY